MYRSLLDAVDVTGDDRYGSGRTQIFYFNKGLFSKFSRDTHRARQRDGPERNLQHDAG